MKLNTKNDYFDFVNSELAWRKKELSYLKSNIKENSPNYKTSLRSGIVLLYAHFEGYIKSICDAFYKFIKNKKLKYNELKENILAVSLKYELENFENSNKSTTHCQLIDFIFNNLDQRARIPSENIIKTNSNLNSNILREILSTVGIDFSHYELKANLIDHTLLKNRNSIAHGEYLELDEIQYNELHAEILFIMDDIKDRLTNLIVLEQYKKTVPLLARESRSYQ